MVGFQSGNTGFLHRDFLDFLQLGFQSIQKQRVNDLVDVLNAGIVHAAAASSFRVQGAFKHSAENGGADRRPVEILAGLGEQNIFQFFGKGRDLDILVGKQTAVYIGECRQSGVIVR